SRFRLVVLVWQLPAAAPRPGPDGGPGPAARSPPPGRFRQVGGKLPQGASGPPPTAGPAPPPAAAGAGPPPGAARLRPAVFPPPRSAVWLPALLHDTRIPGRRDLAPPPALQGA